MLKLQINTWDFRIKLTRPDHSDASMGEKYGNPDQTKR
jgi:chorismate synthase